MNTNITESFPIPASSDSASTAFAGCVASKAFRSPNETKAGIKRSTIAAILKENSAKIIESRNWAKMLCAATILAELDKLGCRPEGITKANALEDVPGKHCLNLLAVSKDGKRRYALRLTDASEEQKTAAQPELAGLSCEASGTLIVA